MTQIKYFIYILLGIFLVLFDVSFLSNFGVYGASVITSFLALIILAISDRGEDYIFFSFVLIILFAIFSSLPLGVIALNFLVLPVILNLIVRKYFPSPNNFTVIFYFIFATFVFDLVLLLWSKDWSVIGFLSLGYFVVINSVAGGLINLIYDLVRKKFTLDAGVKL